MSGIGIIHTQPLGQFGCDRVLVGGIERHRTPIVGGGLGGQQTGGAERTPVLEIRREHVPHAAKRRRSELVGLLFALVGVGGILGHRIAGEHHLDILGVLHAGGVQLELVHDVLRLNGADPFRVGHLHIGVRGESGDRAGHQHHTHARFLGQIQRRHQSLRVLLGLPVILGDLPVLRFDVVGVPVDMLGHVIAVLAGGVARQYGGGHNQRDLVGLGVVLARGERLDHIILDVPALPCQSVRGMDVDVFPREALLLQGLFELGRQRLPFVQRRVL